MHVMAARVALVALTIAQGSVGIMARLDPRGFYDDFPFGREWVAPDGPYNEHLLTDFGAALLAIAVMTLVAAWRPTREVVIAAALANIVFGGFHFAYHLGTRDLFSTTDNVLSLTAIGLGVVLGLLLLPLSRGLGQSPKSEERSIRRSS